MDRRDKSGEEAEGGYGILQVIDILGMRHKEFVSMHRWDQRILSYFVRMKKYYEWKSLEDAKKKGNGK